VTDAAVLAFPRALTDYPEPAGPTLAGVLAQRIELEPFNAIATTIFALAIVHTFSAARFAALAHRIQRDHEKRAIAEKRPIRPSVTAELLHFFGEIEVVFGLWAVVLAVALSMYAGLDTATHYFNDTVDYKEALFVVVIMTMAATRPIVGFAESMMKTAAAAGSGTPAAWWLAILIVAPLLGSLITEPAAMTIAALLLSRHFFDRRPSVRLKYATLGLLFVNVSIGGTLTHFAAPPVLMVSAQWGWDTAFMLAHFGWRAAVAIVVSTLAYYLLFKGELIALTSRIPLPAIEQPAEEATGPALLPVPFWLTASHALFMVFTVLNAHHPVLLIGGFLFYLGFARATAAYQSRLELKTPLLVGFFLAGLVIHGRLQGWWIEPVLRGLNETPLFLGATLLTAFNDNALITFLAAQVPNMAPALKTAVVEGAVTGGGLTVIANAPNPAGQALLRQFFPDDAVSPLWLAAGALAPTAVAAAAFRLL
jgi:putative Na+/H+ antiporter